MSTSSRTPPRAVVCSSRACIGGALSIKRRFLGFAVALIGGPLLSWLLYATSSPDSITADVLAYQLLVVVVALIGGIWPALFAAVLSGLTLDYLFIEPLGTVTIADPDHALSLVLYVVIAVLVSWIVDQAARRTRVGAARGSRVRAARDRRRQHPARAERRPRPHQPRPRGIRHDGVRLVAPDGAVIATDGEPVPDGRMIELVVGDPAAPRATLELHGGELDASARRLLDIIVAQLGAALEHTDLTATAREAGLLAETDQVRSALLSAVSHDLRRPLAAAVAAVGGVGRRAGLSESDRDELLATADESLATLSALVTDLLDVSRVEAGVLAVSLAPVDSAGTVLAAVDELSLGPDAVELALDPDLPLLVADPVLLQRVVVNVLANAVRHTAPGTRVRVATSRLGARAQIRIVDHGAGVAPDRQADIFAPFQRLGDTDNTTGLGLGLALSRGFTEGMGGTLAPEDTPGGGLTMVVELPVADSEAPRASA